MHPQEQNKGVSALACVIQEKKNLDQNDPVWLININIHCLSRAFIVTCNRELCRNPVRNWDPFLPGKHQTLGRAPATKECPSGVTSLNPSGIFLLQISCMEEQEVLLWYISDPNMRLISAEALSAGAFPWFDRICLLSNTFVIRWYFPQAFQNKHILFTEIALGLKWEKRKKPDTFCFQYIFNKEHFKLLEFSVKAAFSKTLNAKEILLTVLWHYNT